MGRHRHVLTLRFLIDLDDDEHVDAPAAHGEDVELVSERLARTVRDHPAAQWALLALALGPLAAAETEDALAAALDMTPQRAIGVLAELCDLSDGEARPLEQAAMHGTLDQAIPLLGEALRVLLTDAELYRVVEVAALDNPIWARGDATRLSK